MALRAVPAGLGPDRRGARLTHRPDARALLRTLTWLALAAGMLLAWGCSPRENPADASRAPASAAAETPESAASPTGTSAAEQGAATDRFPYHATVDSATGFTVSYHATYKVVTVTRPWPGATQRFTYLLVERGTRAPAGYPGAIVVTVPVRRVAALSDSYLGEIEMLGEDDTITAVQTVSYVYSPRIRQRVANGAAKQVGEGATTNIELLLSLSPDLVMTEAYGGSDELYPKLVEAGLPVVLNGDWAELTPLGRAEWIKFIALFYDRERQASALFDATAREYHRLQRLAASAASRPTVFVDTPWQGTWGMPGGRSYVAALLRDAGANYLWSGNDSTGTLLLDLESVVARAAGADFWLNTGDWTTRAEVTAADPRFASFRAVRQGALYGYTARRAPPDANDYWETGPARPQVVLADLIKILHPELEPDHALYYYQRLK